MINESTLNDVFKFVELKPANILSPFPLTKTPEIIDTQDESLELKREKAEAFLTALNFDIEHLKYGKLIVENLDKLLQQNVQSTAQLISINQQIQKSCTYMKLPKATTLMLSLTRSKTT